MNNIRLESHYKYIEQFDFFDKKIINYNINYILLKIPTKSFIINIQILLKLFLEMFCVQKCSFFQKTDSKDLLLFLTIRKCKMYLYLDFCINYIYIFNNKSYLINNLFDNSFNIYFFQKMWVQLYFLFNKKKIQLYMYPNPNFFIDKYGLKEFFFVP
uniref:Uncharacterized protein n=1 Tax=Plocamium cartilagineum TaxID=31452 RepID=A0A0E3DBS3_PLOCA|nr:hypothetical protein Pcati.mt.36 [Plocamium cartilagineum]